MTYINSRGERFTATSILLPAELHERVKREGINTSALVRQLLTDYLDTEGVA